MRRINITSPSRHCRRPRKDMYCRRSLKELGMMLKAEAPSINFSSMGKIVETGVEVQPNLDAEWNIAII
jgi:hypothetical protein